MMLIKVTAPSLIVAKAVAVVVGPRRLPPGSVLVCRRSADCPNPQRANRQRRLKMVARVGLASRCELGQLARRSNQDTPCRRGSLPVSLVSA